jgi:N-methylhydantoinase A
MTEKQSTTKQVRVGIDVGGTFTHAVAIDGATLEIIGRAKVPTTHTAAEGVAKGIIDSLNTLLDGAGIVPSAVSFIAHSTTQATNALLEGDVAPVGVIGMGKGASAWFARMATDIGAIELAPGKFLQTHCEFVDTSKPIQEKVIRAAVSRLKEKGAQAIAVSEAFGVDESTNEEKVTEIARSMGMPATCGSEVSKLYGLKVRTRTAVINAAMLPKMIETANMTEESVRASGIKAPIMIMRSDGGVMDIDAMRKRPILTMLSGPAAGVAAAMMYLNISDGIFLEVGGTSTDISVIRNGKALVKGAEIGGHRVYMRTLDVITVGVAGGSMLRTSKNAIVDVGPRSAHIAGLGYASFHEPVANPSFVHIQPKPSDPADYLAIAKAPGDKPELCLTPTCASNFLGLVPEGDCARGNEQSIQDAFAALAKHLGGNATTLATATLTRAYEKCLPVVTRFIADYKLDTRSLTLIGGGGGGAAIVPFVAKTMNVQHALAENADVVSAIGVALALVRETVERNIVQPKPDDILKIREEAFQAVHKMGADPNSIEIHVEVDSRANVVRATAFGAAGVRQSSTAYQTLTEPERVQLAARSMNAQLADVKVLAKTPFFEVFSAEVIDRKFFGLLPAKLQALRTLDDKGVIRLQTRNGVVRRTTAADADKVLAELAEEHAHYGDAGKILPDMMLLAGARIIDLTGMADPLQIAALARTELANFAADTPAIVMAGLQ